MEQLEFNGIPKCHMLLEMAARLHFHGAPTAYACWIDETLNCPLKRIGQTVACAATHVWEQRVLQQWANLSDKIGEKHLV